MYKIEIAHPKLTLGKLLLASILAVVGYMLLSSQPANAAILDPNTNQQIHSSTAPRSGCAPHPVNWGVGVKIIVRIRDANGNFVRNAETFTVRMQSVIRDDNTGTALPPPAHQPGDPLDAILVDNQRTGYTPPAGHTQESKYSDVRLKLDNTNGSTCNGNNSGYVIDSGFTFDLDNPGGPGDSGMDHVALDCVNPGGGKAAAKFIFSIESIDDAGLGQGYFDVETRSIDGEINGHAYDVYFDYYLGEPSSDIIRCDRLEIIGNKQQLSVGEQVQYRGYAAGPPNSEFNHAFEYHVVPRGYTGPYSATTKKGAGAYDSSDKFDQNGSFVDPQGGGTRSYTFSQAGEFEIRLRLVQSGLSRPGSARGECVKSFQVAKRPYFRVYGNDVRAGGRFEFACNEDRLDPAANIKAFSKDITGNNRVGGAAQLAVSATGEIDGFFSAGRRNGIAAPNPIAGLTFGNLGESGPTTGFGGESGMARCIPDYYEIAIGNGIPTQNSTGSVRSIPGFSLSNNADRIDLYQTNVHISENITYANATNWSSTDQIPSYALIVKGHDIFINRSVTQLDGLYIAIPDEQGNGGRIFTCSGNGRTVPSTDGINNIASRCTQKLTVNGAFIARQVRFLRSSGDIEGILNPNEPASDTQAAEVFNFSQEVYLAAPSGLQRGSTTGRYDSILSLPPVL